MKTVILTMAMILTAGAGLFAEGSKELNTNNIKSTGLHICNDYLTHCWSGGIRNNFAAYDAPPDERLFFTVLNSSEKVYLGFRPGTISSTPPGSLKTIVFRIREAVTGNIAREEQCFPQSYQPGYISTLSQAINGPTQLGNPSGYTALVFTPPASGIYFIEFSLRYSCGAQIIHAYFNIDLFDITVADTLTMTAKPGRLYSKAWQFNELHQSNGNNGFYGDNYILTNDGLVYKISFSNFWGFFWNQAFNEFGCSLTGNWFNDRKSVPGLHTVPQYLTFLNLPDPVAFPSSPVPGQIISGITYLPDCQNSNYTFQLQVSKAGKVQCKLQFQGGYTMRTIMQDVNAGPNILVWDGYDGAGQAVAGNTHFTVEAGFINGLTNFNLFDAETNTNGIQVSLVNPPGPAPELFWDDSNLPGGTINASAPGCISPPGCHSWGNNFGNENTINTWWYFLSSYTPPSSFIHHRIPQTPEWTAGNSFVHCAGDSGVIFSVIPDPDIQSFHWSYSPPDHVTLLTADSTGTSVIVNFGPASQTGTLSVYGTNSTCPSVGPALSSTVIIDHSLPAAPGGLIAGDQFVIPGSTGLVYSIDSIPGSRDYHWTTPAGTTITAGSGTRQITLDFATTFTGGDLLVAGSNGCGAGPMATPFHIQVFDPITMVTFICDSLACISDTIQFPPYTPANGIIHEIWNYGDGHADTINQPGPFPHTGSHHYSQPGTYTVTRFVTFSDNQTISFSRTVLIVPLPANLGECTNGTGSLSGLFAYYPLDTNTLDYSGHQLHGIPNNINFGSGHEGGAARFFGNGDSYINLGPWNIPDTFSISMFIKKEVYPFPDYNGQQLFAKYDDLSGNYRSYYLDLPDTAGFARTAIHPDGEAQYLTDATIAVPVDQWYHIAATYNGSNRSRIYINGQLNTENLSIPSTGIFNSEIPVYLGRDHQDYGNRNCQYFGWMDEVKIFSRELSASEIQQLSNAVPPCNMLAVSVENDSVCSGGSSAVIIHNSQQEINYQLTLNGVPFGSSLPGNGADLAFQLTNLNQTSSFQIHAARNTPGCGITLDTALTIFVTPGSYTLTSDTIICRGETVTLAATGGLSYLWSNGMTTSSITVVPQYTTTYSIAIIPVPGCIITDSVQVTVNNLPANIGQSSGAGSVPSAGLVAWYPFNGNASDESGNGHHGIVNGAVLSPDRFGNANSAYYFDFSSIHAEIPYSPSFTLTAWFRYQDLSNWYPTVLALGNEIALCQADAWYGTGNYYAFLKITDSTGVSTLSGNVNDGNWHSMAIAFNDSSKQANFYLDGNMILDSIVNGTVVYYDFLDIGRSFSLCCGYWDGTCFHGYADDIRLYNKYLDAGQINSINNGLPQVLSVMLENDSICSGGYTSVKIINSQAGIAYQLYNNGNVYGSPSTGTGDTLTMPVSGLTGSASVTIQATNPATSCSIILDTLLQVVVLTGEPVSVVISADKTTLCSGDTVVCSSSVTNGGFHPQYQWFINSTDIAGATNSTFSFVPLNGDVVTCEVISDMVCNAGSTAISNGLYMFVYPEPLLSLNGPTSACVNSTGHLYTTEAGMTNYAWSISGGTITAGGGAADHNAVVTWTDVGQQTISINYANPQGCSARVPVQLQVDVTSGLAPGWPGVVNGPSYVAFNQTKTYSVAPVSNALGYVWQIPPGTVMISGANTNTIVVDFPAATATSGPISVHGVNSCGNGPASPVLMVTLGPAVPDTVYLGNLTFGSGMTSCFNALETIIVAGQGTWFSVENGASVTLISGKRILIQPTTHLYTGAYFHAYITPDHQYCGSLPQSMVAVNTGGESFPEIADDPHFRVWPNPTGGEFTLEVTGLSPQERTCFEMYDLQGVRIRDFSELTNGSFRFSLNDKPRGLYLIKLVHASGTDLIRLIKD